jgi:uncharacterized membrane protein YjdF
VARDARRHDPDALATQTSGRPPATPAERTAVVAALVATFAFGTWAVVSGAPSTTTYILSAPVGILVIGWLRREPLPDALAVALAIHAVLHLAGGLIRVGDDVLYNAAIGPYSATLHTHVLQYDHLVHAFGSFVATLTVWTLLTSEAARTQRKRETIILCVLASLGIGALNEMVEFLATVAHSGAHVGGYDNTGWDLVSNCFGALVGAAVLAAGKLDAAPS